MPSDQMVPDPFPSPIGDLWDRTHCLCNVWVQKEDFPVSVWDFFDGGCGLIKNCYQSDYVLFSLSVLSRGKEDCTFPGKGRLVCFT